ncbi:uncharacterized protein LOC106649726 isoform X2 [Trichogramma pretiosum]|uniref:uncharacterized protein LOC106649726 isoform X2 n=1 Tax=Trichogramma pretiosum TaxID=7493 RepID=UPI0006C9BE2F|nr:uncharacterized protein LOC106649726 isoform X2 [Trichogramma pretiosum]
MVLWASLLVLHGACIVGSSTGMIGMPENITVMFLSPTSVRVSWSTNHTDHVEKYDVIYKPTDARVVAVVAGNSEAITLGNLRSNTQYQLVVTAVKDNKKLRSRPIVFRTLEPTKPHLQDVSIKASSPLPPLQQQRTYIQIRAVEVGLVLLALVVWAGAIALFFNRWGKIRMLLPYQPDFKDQLKVPGTGVCNSSNTGHNHSTGQPTCPQHSHCSNHHIDHEEKSAKNNNFRISRSRINSAIDVTGVISQRGFASQLYRKVHSADNIRFSLHNNHDSETQINDLNSNEINCCQALSERNKQDQNIDVSLPPKNYSNHNFVFFNAESNFISLPNEMNGCYRTSYEINNCHTKHLEISVNPQTSLDEYQSNTKKLPSDISESSTNVGNESFQKDTLEVAQQKNFGLPILSVSEPSPLNEVADIESCF